MYIRLKTIKNKEYAYLVKSKYYKRKPPKQMISKYLGRVYTPHKYLNNNINKENAFNNIEEFLKSLIELEIKNHNLYEHFIIDFDKFKIKNKKGNSCVIRINNGYLCDYTLKNLLKFEPSSLDEKTFSKELARALIESGIQINNDMFVLLFDKVYKKKAHEN